jgi:dTDP-4-amino-4,6-dideoxygalactose transaminase
MKIQFNKPYMTGKELDYIREAHANGHLSGGGPFTKKCQGWLESNTGCHKALLTHSCTGALEMSAILCGIAPGDEIIMPSYTFVSTANAFVLRGGVPVFIDIRPDNLNIDEKLIEEAVTPKTKAIAVVHYAGVGCDMDAVMETAARRGLAVVEDAAQGIMSSYKGRALGSIGDLGALSFHETKNIISGEGGALLINRPDLVERGEIVWEKGTNRRKFFRGEIDKYTWVDIGSSFLPGGLIAAFLWAQMERAEEITKARLALWDTYYRAFESAEKAGRVRRPIIPPECVHNAHMYYLIMPDNRARDEFIAAMKRKRIGVVFHYVPLHSSEAGRRYGRACGSLPVTDGMSSRIVRLPMWTGLEEHLGFVIEQALAVIETL